MQMHVTDGYADTPRGQEVEDSSLRNPRPLAFDSVQRREFIIVTLNLKDPFLHNRSDYSQCPDHTTEVSSLSLVRRAYSRSALTVFSPDGHVGLALC